MANNNFFLFEDTFEESQESKSIESAKKYLIGIGYDEKAADEYVRVELRNNFPALRDKKTAKFILGMTRISIEELEVLTPSNMVELNNILKLITEGHYNEYDRNLNGLTGGKLFKRFSSVKANNAEEDKKTLSGKKYQKSEYKIIPINSFEEAQKYSNYTDWCITNNKNMFDTYTNNGINQFYFCLKNGFENVPKEKGENCPLDDYGLSMLAVCVDEHGYLYTCTSRWNHDCGSDDSVMNVLQVSDVIGESFYNVFKPNNNFTDTINSIEKRLQNGENPEEIFDIVGDFINGVANVVVGNKANWITSDGKIFYPEMWFDTTDPFFNGFAVVSLKHSWNFMRIDRKLCNKHIWLDSIESVFNKNGLAIVKYNDKLCYYKTNGRLIPKRCDLDFIGKFGINNLAMASGIIDGVRKFNFIDLDGKLISPKLWFDFVDAFEDGFAPVEINDKYNYINSEGEYLTPDRWYDDAWQFEDGLGEVSYNDEWWNIDTKGQLIKNPSLNESIRQDLNKARKNTDKTPSEAQKKSGNYKKGHININGFRISLENPKGSYRKGVDSNGREWKTKMKNDYGYFLNTVGYDNDHIDVFLGNKIDSKKIFVIDQRINGKFDESKVMLWFNTENEAKKAYLSNYEKNWKGFYKITEVDEELFKTWLYDGKKQRKPFYQYKAIKEYNKKMNIKENFIREVIKEAIARVSIHEANENTLLTNKLIKVLYKIASKYTSKIYTDDAWEGVHALMDNLRSVNGVESLDYGGGRYHSISKNIGEGTYKAYNIKIMTTFNTTIGGELRCHFSGTNDDPWSRYDMSISLWRQNEEPNMFESKNTITESRGLHSQKLYNLISAHGGFAKGVHNFYLNSLTDNDIIGELSEIELSSLHDAYPRDLIAWAKNKGYEVDKGDNVELLPLKDYAWIAIIERGSLLPDKEYIKTSVGALKDKRNHNKTKLDGAKNYRWQDTDKWGSERQNKFQSINDKK